MNEINFDAASFIADNEGFNTIDIVDKAYEQGKKDRDREIAESAVFVSNKPIEDIVLDAIAEERLRIVRELKENKKSLVGKHNSSTPMLEMPSYKAAFNNGIDAAIKIVEEM